MPKEKVEVAPPPQKNIYKYLFFALLLIFLAASLTAVGYFLGTNGKTAPGAKGAVPSGPVVSRVEPVEGQKPAATKTPVATSSAKLPDTSDWLTYVNQRFHYSLKYPPYLILEALSEGDGGTFISEKEPVTQGGMRKTMVVDVTYLTDANKNLSLEQFVQTQGYFINPCHEPKPEKTESIITASGLKGIKAWYWVEEGCQGAAERGLNDPYVFFDRRPQADVFVTLFEAQMDKEFDTIARSVEFLEPKNYGD